MLKKILILVVASISSFSWADDQDLFEDSSVFEEIEFDPDFEDDFDNIEEGSFGGDSHGSVISPSDKNFEKRNWFRYEPSISGTGGNTIIDRVVYLTIYPQARLNFSPVYTHLGMPLNFPIYDNISQNRFFKTRERGFVPGNKFIVPRRKDFRSWTDAQRVIRHVELFTPRDPYYFRLSRNHALSFSEGELVRGLNQNYLYDQDYLFLSGRGKFSNFEISGLVGPLPVVNLFGLNSRFAPLTSLDAPSFVKDINFDIGYIADYRAPNHVKQAGDDYLVNNKGRLLERDWGTAQGISVGALTKFAPLTWLNISPYTTWANLILTGIENNPQGQNFYGLGFHIGNNLVFNFSNSKFSQLSFNSELRLFSDTYMPGYFGETYMLDRQSMGENISNNFRNGPLTKSQLLALHNGDSFRYGYFFGLKYAYENIVNASIGYENARRTNNNTQLAFMRKFHARSNTQILEIVNLSVAYEATAIDDMTDFFNLDKSRSFVRVGGQVKLLPYMYFDAWAKHSFGLKEVFELAQVQDLEPVLLSQRDLEPSLNFGLGLEFAWEF